MDEQHNEKMEEINLRSEEVQEIMGRIPSWTERWGITVIGLVVVTLLAGTALFPFPDSLTGQFIFIPQNDIRQKHPVGYVLLPVHGIGMVKNGMDVTVRLDNYPDGTFGYLNGKVYNIANMPDNEGLYQVSVFFPNGLITSESIQLPTKSQLSGTAEIIVAKKRLIDKIRKSKTFQ